NGGRRGRHSRPVRGGVECAKGEREKQDQRHREAVQRGIPRGPEGGRDRFAIHQLSFARRAIRAANSPTFAVASTSPTRKRTLKWRSTATTRDTWSSESHSGTSLAES